MSDRPQPVPPENLAVLVGSRGGRRVVAVRGLAGDGHVSGVTAAEWQWASEHVAGFTEMVAALGITKASEGLE